MANIREVAEGTQEQGADEVIAYTVDTTNWGGTPTGVSVEVKELGSGTWTDVTATVMPTNTPTVDTNTITLSPLQSLTAGKQYKVEITCTISGNTVEPFFLVSASE